MQKPFDELPAVTELIRLYKEGVTQNDLMYYFQTTKENIQNTLRVYIGEERIYRKKMASRPSGFYTPTVEVVVELQVVKPLSKYDHLLEEPVNKGHDYEYLLKQQGYKKPKLDNFNRIRTFKVKKELPCE